MYSGVIYSTGYKMVCTFFSVGVGKSFGPKIGYIKKVFSPVPYEDSLKFDALFKHAVHTE